MKGNKKFALLYVVLAVIVSVGAVVFQHILENSYLDRNGLYQPGVLTPEIFVIYAVLSALLILTVVFSLRFDIVPKEMKTGTVNTSIVSGLAAIALVYASILFLMNGMQPYYAPGTSEAMVRNLELVASIVAFPAALYYMLTAFSGKVRAKATAYLSFFPIVWTLMFVMSMYFDRTTLINSPVKSLQQFAWVVFMIYQLYEIRACIGKGKMVASYVFSLLSTLFLSAAFVPTVIDMVMGTKNLTADSVYCVIGSVMALYTLSRAIDFSLNSEIDISKIIEQRRREEQEKTGKTEENAPVKFEQKVENEEVSPVSEIESLLGLNDDRSDEGKDNKENIEDTTENVVEEAVEEAVEAVEDETEKVLEVASGSEETAI